MNMKMKIACIALLVTFAPFAVAGPAPEAMNFQGVLRDASGAPLDGSYDMTFRLYEFASAGTVLYTDAHLAAGFGAVSVSEGLFTVAIGTGDHGNQVLSDVFRDHIDVWVEIEIAGEILSPRVQAHAAGHALNATHAELAGDAGLLDGVDSSQFLRSDTDSVSSGRVTASELQSNGSVFVNGDGPNEDSFVYFYDSTQTQRYFKWNDLNGRFETSNRFKAPTLESPTIDGTDYRVYGDLYFNWNGPNQDGNIYFHRNGSNTGEWIRWNDFADIFETSKDLLVHGQVEADGIVRAKDDLQVYGDVYINPSGQSGIKHIYFYDNGSSQGEWLSFEPLFNEFHFTDDVVVSTEIKTWGTQISINDEGGNANQDIEFYNNGSQTERFQWDATALRFEVSDDFHAFGDLSTSGAKPFVQNHPHRDDLEIVYAAMEGNEVTTFTRGSGRLVGGEARIRLEESFGYVTNPDIGLSAHLTPRGDWSELYVDTISTRELVVRGDRDIAFDFVVYGLRIGYEDYPVYRPKRAESFAPPPGTFAEEFADEPALADHTAIERYRKMTASAFGEADTEMRGAWALREAIGMREPDLDFPRGSDIPVREMNRIALEKERGVADVVREGAVEPIADPSVEDVSTPTGETAPQTATATLRRDDQGNVYARSFRPSAGDIASVVRVGEPVEAGDVLVIDPHGEGGMVLARNQGDTTVFGVVAAEPGVVLGARDSEVPSDDAEQPLEAAVAVSGVVLCKVDASWGPIRPGDLLMTSPTPGHAMRADEPRIGNVLGKALEPLEVGTGLIRVLVTLR